MQADLSAFGRSEFSLGALPVPPPTPEPQELDYPILAPDPNLMANLAAEEKQKDYMKYLLIALLGMASGYFLGREYTKSAPTAAAVGGIGALALVLTGDYVRNRL
jgi:hypothetical protein